MRRVPSFSYGSTTFACSLPALPWTPVDESIGGWRDAASGTPASYVVRRDFLVDLTLRIREGEWTAFDNLLQHGQSAQPIAWTPDLLEAGTTFEVYLVDPKPGARYTPTRSNAYPRVFEVTITLRGRGTVVPWPAYFTDS